MDTRLVLIGAGAIATSYAAAAHALSGCRFVGVIDVREEVGRALAREVGCEYFASHRQVMNEVECDGALVCTPPRTHESICCDLLQAGIAVLCEKPLSCDGGSARRMYAVADDAGMLLTMCTKFRFAADVIAAKRIIETGIIGDVIQVRNTFASYTDMTARWNSDPGVSGGGVLIDNGTHSVDLVRFLIGPVERILAIGARNVQPVTVEDGVWAVARTASGINAFVDLSWSSCRRSGYFLEVEATGGDLCVGWKGSFYRRVGDDQDTKFGVGYNKLDSLAGQLENFCAAVRGDALPAVSKEDAIASVDVIQAAYGSMGSGGWRDVASASDVDAENSTVLV